MQDSSTASSRNVVYAALIGNLLVGVTKGVAAFITGSSAMLSEGIHSFVDTGNEVLLLYGMRRAARPADERHPLGHGRELYFWSFVVALLIFALGAGVSIYSGVHRIYKPQPIENVSASYIVLLLAFVFEGATWLIALRKFKAIKGELGFYEAFRRSKDPPSFMVLFEDTAALLGIMIAAVGTFAAVTLHMPKADGLASILIGCLLAGTSILLARESKSLLIGEPAHRELNDAVLRIVAQHARLKANGLMTFQIGANQIVVALSLEFADEMRAPEIEHAVVNIERRIREEHPEVISVFVKPQTL